MSPRELGSILLAASGFLVVALRLPEALIGLTVAFAYQEASSDPVALAAGLAPFISPLVGVLLIVWRRPIADRLFAEESPSERPATWPVVQHGLLLVLGVFFVTAGTAHLVSPAAAAWRGERLIYEDPFAYAAAFEIAAGLCLVLSGPGILGAIAAFRNAGRERLKREHGS